MIAVRTTTELERVQQQIQDETDTCLMWLSIWAISFIGLAAFLFNTGRLAP